MRAGDVQIAWMGLRRIGEYNQTTNVNIDNMNL